MKAIIPAMDISGGRCVRLTQGNFDTKKVYAPDPVELVQEYYNLGAKRIHVVDLDAAFGRGNNRSLISEMCQAVPSDCIIEVGGGIRDDVDVKALLGMGIKRLCLGTVLVKDVFQVVHWTNKFGRVFVGSLDAKNNEVHILGWQQEGAVKVQDFLKQINNINLCSIEYTNIEKDGMLSGPDMKSSEEIANASHVPIIITGGIGSTEDVDKVMACKNKNIVGIILGKALFEGLVDLGALFKKYPSPDCSEW